MKAALPFLRYYENYFLRRMLDVEYLDLDTGRFQVKQYPFVNVTARVDNLLITPENIWYEILDDWWLAMARRVLF